MKEHEDRMPEELIEGRNAVTEALRAGTAIEKLYIARGETDRTLGRIIAEAKKAGVVVAEADRRKLDAMSETHSHQGVIAVAAAQRYAAVEDVLAATGYRTPTIWGRSSARRSARGRMGSSSRSAAARG